MGTVVSSTRPFMSDDTTSAERGEVVADVAAKSRMVCWLAFWLLLFVFFLREETWTKGVRSSLEWVVSDGASDGGGMVLGG